MQFKHLVFYLSFTLFLLIGFYFFLVQQTTIKQTDRPRIICTTTIIADTIKNIAQDSIDLKILMGPGVDPHAYKPIEQDIITIVQADLIFYNGLHLEARMADIFERLGNKTVAITSDMPKNQLIYSKEFNQYPDPHVWFDPMLWIYAVHTIATHLQKMIPQNFEQYENNKHEFIQKIHQTYQTTKEMMLKIQPEQRDRKST